MRVTTTNVRAFALTGSVLMAIACAGQTADGPPSPGGTGATGDSGTSGPSSNGNGDLDAGTPGVVADAGRTPKPKAVGSPCAADTDCAGGLSCNASFPNGMCTKACTTDTDCAGKSGTTGACVNAMCFALCAVDADAGAIDADGGADADGGKPKAPCKNKSFECATPPGRTDLVCLPPGDAGTEPADSGLSD